MAATFSPIMTALLARLNYHKGDGLLLDGIKVKEFPESEISGHKDLPQVGVFIPDIFETFSWRAPTSASMTLRISISTKRGATNPLQTHLEWIEKVLDALETTHDGAANKDSTLDGTIRKPFDVSLGNAFAEEISLNSQLTLTVVPRALVIRANRRT